MGGSGDSRDYSSRSTGGGTAPAGGPGAGSTSDDGCARLTFPATLSSPEPTVVETLLVGQVLNVVRTEREGVRLVEVRTADGRLTGTLTSSLPDLLRCIEAGFTYAADVVSRDGGVVRVQVRSGAHVGCGDVRYSELVIGDDEAVIAGQQLEVVAAGLSVVLRDDAGEVIGTVTTNVERLLPCLLGGVLFVAVVTAAHDGRVEVDIRPAP